MDISVSQIKDSLDYCQESGVLTWKVRPKSHFKSSTPWKGSNTRRAGKVAGNKFTNSGGKNYLSIRLLYTSVLAHRAAWAIYHGEWPKYTIDHINGDGTDNRLCNLRDVPIRENHLNHRKNSNNKSGACGVCFIKKYSKWMAFITVKYKKINLGCFDDFFEAVCARKSAEVAHGYHKNHGEDRPL